MASLLSKFTYIKSENISSDNYEEIDDAESITINIGSEGKNNNLKITLKNPISGTYADRSSKYRWLDSNGTIIFKAVKATKGQVINEEIIEIYAKYEENDPTLDVFSEDYLLFSGIINKGKIIAAEDSNKIELMCLDRSVVMLDKLVVPTGYTQDDNLSAPEIVQRLVRLAVDGVPSDSKSFDSSGNLGVGLVYYVDARTFTEGIKVYGLTTSTTSRRLIDSGATFISSGVAIGDWVRNATTNEYAYVKDIISETELKITVDIFSSGDGYYVSDGFIQDRRVDGTVFPVIPFSMYDKPVVDAINKLSSTENINSSAELNSTLIMERNMRWFLDKKNRFHYYYPDDTPKYEFEVGALSAVGQDDVFHKIIKVELDNEVRGNVNYIVFKAGTNINNVMIRGFARAKFSGTPTIKESYRAYFSIAEQMKDAEVKKGNLSLDTGGTTYTVLTGYPFVPTWQSDGTTVANLTEYKLDFIAEARRRGRVNAQSEFQKLANPRWAGQILIKGEDVLVGDLLNFTSKSHGLYNVLMRINQVTHSITADQGWITTLNVEEDEIIYNYG